MGFDHYYGLNEYPTQKDSDGIWGIYDEPYLQYMARELSRRPQPFASVVFTLSTHNPYQIPPQYQGLLPKGELPIHGPSPTLTMLWKSFLRPREHAVV